MNPGWEAALRQEIAFAGRNQEEVNTVLGKISLALDWVVYLIYVPVICSTRDLTRRAEFVTLVSNCSLSRSDSTSTRDHASGEEIVSLN